MIKLFRNIRQKLVAEGKTTTYIKYAIGEIVLVVIGILIALQINNWNEDRKLKLQEVSILKDIQTDLKASLLEIDRNIDGNEKTVYDTRMIAKYLEEDLPYEAVLDTAFGRITAWKSPYFTFTAYETLKNKGLDLIQNTELKKALVNIYEFEFAFLEKDYDQSEWVLAQSITYPVSNKHLRRNITSKTLLAYPNNYEALKTNDEFINMLTSIIIFREGGIIKLKEVKEKLLTLIDEIDKELNSR
jgi:hypothetical protein